MIASSYVDFLADDSVSSDDLEANWTTMMKTDSIHEKLGSNPALKDSALFKVVMNGTVPLLKG